MRLVLSAAAIAGVLSALGTIQASAPAIYLQFYLLIEEGDPPALPGWQ